MTSSREVNGALKQELKAARSTGVAKDKKIEELEANLSEATKLAYDWCVKGATPTIQGE